MESAKIRVLNTVNQTVVGTVADITLPTSQICFFLSLPDCPALQTPHAVVNPATRVAHGTTMIVDCPAPFTLVGNPRPTCNNGAFTDVPSCEKSDIFNI